MTPQVRTGMTHVGTAVGTAVAMAAWMSSHKVNLYAIWDQVNGIIAAMTTLIATVTPLATAAYGVYKASTKQKLEDIAADPKAPEIAKEIPVTPNTVAVANALKEPT